MNTWEKPARIEDEAAADELRHLIIVNAQLRYIEAVLKRGVDPNQKVRNMNSAVHTAVMHSRNDVLILLKDYGADFSDKAEFDYMGYRAIHCAVLFASADTIKTLCQLGANINGMNKTGHTPLFLCANVQHNMDMQRKAEMLLSLGADPNIRDANDNTPLHYALVYNRPDLAKTLLLHNADPNACGGNNVLPLHLAMDINPLDAAPLLRALKAAGADFNRPAGKDGERPLHRLVKLNAFPLLAEMLALGADPLLTDACGETPLALAERLKPGVLITHLLQEATLDAAAQKMQSPAPPSKNDPQNP